MILGDDLTPVSQLSSAFLSPKSPLHLQFAYYESSLVVRYLIDIYGLDTLQRVLIDLSAGMPINRSLGRYVGSVAQLDQEFAKYARETIQSVAPDVEFGSVPELAKLRINATKLWLEEHPNHYQGLLH
ncbi:MAG: hypothetical protein IIA41_14595, partial [SAR324 cluster bacterium]|nr:hypothetical protein [SAR324 cluster bacterium]